MKHVIKNILLLGICILASATAWANITVHNQTEGNVGATLYVLSGGGQTLFPKEPTRTILAAQSGGWKGLHNGTIFSLVININEGSKFSNCTKVTSSVK